VAVLNLWMATASYGDEPTVKYDTLSGLTPGHVVGGNVYPKDGGDPIPLAETTVADDGTATFAKPSPPSGIGRIEYENRTTGKKIAGMATVGGTDVWALIDPGNRFGLFNTELAPLTTWHMVDAYDQSIQLAIGDVFYFNDGWCDPVPGVYLEALGSAYTGYAGVYGFNLVTPEPSSLALLAIGALPFALRRRTSP